MATRVSEESRLFKFPCKGSVLSNLTVGNGRTGLAHVHVAVTLAGPSSGPACGCRGTHVTRCHAVQLLQPCQQSVRCAGGEGLLCTPGMRLH